MALAFAVARNAAPRVRYAIAVVAFFAAAVAPFVIPSESEGPGRTGGAVTVPAQPTRSLADARDDSGREIPYAPIVWLTITVLLLAREALGHAVLHFRRREW